MGLRMQFLEQFNTYIHLMFGEDIIEYWYSEVFPKNYNYYNLKKIASDEKLWIHAVDTFSECCKRARVIE